MSMMRGTIEFQWLASEPQPALLTTLQAKFDADESFDAQWADQPAKRFKVMSISHDLAGRAGSGLLTIWVNLVAETLP